jgi:acyl-CoA synthetase (AMP-forming)/AMP-acid ligase II
VDGEPFQDRADAVAEPPGAFVGQLTRADAHPALVATDTGRTTTHAELQEGIDRLAGQIAAAGIDPGDTVALSLVNGPASVLSFLGVVAAGAAAAPLNPAYTESELQSYLEDLRPRALIRDAHVGGAAETVARRLGVPVHVLADAPDAPVQLEGIAPKGGRRPDAPDAVALLLHTSGTTSRPKCVPIRQRNLAASIRTIGATYALGPADVSHCVMPLFHVHGLVASTLATLAAGGTVVIPPRFSASEFWANGAEHGATWYSAVPTIHQILLARMQDGDVPAHGLRFARSCSSALPEAVWSQFEDRLGVPLLQAYGMTEAAHQMTSNPLPPGVRNARTVGLPTGVEVAVLDDDWNALGVAESGEVAVRGPSVIDGYRDNPEANAASFRDGWFRTGDRGSITAEGYVTLDGRIKELINRGGEKISPHEIEEALLAHPGVAEAVAFAAPDEIYGEQVGAAVVMRDGTEVPELLSHCADRLASFKVPAFIKLLDEIPKGPTGKLQRRLMSDLAGR